MKALLLSEYKNLSLQDVPDPVIAPEDALIRVKSVAICGSDVHGYDGSTGRRIPPLIMGHEASGEVAQIGAGVKGLRQGDRVTFDSTVYCGQCFFCQRGQINLCDNRQVLGVSCGDYRRHGAFAEYVAVPQRIIHPIPDDLGFDHAAMIEPVSIALHAVNRARPALNETAVVVGAGMIGLFIIQALRASGCGRIIAVDVAEEKFALARMLGANEALNPGDSGAMARIMELSGRRGADLAFEVVGTAPALQTAIASLRKGGRLSLVGNLTLRVELPLQTVVTRELTLLGSCSSCGDYPAVIAMIARGAISVAPLISARAPLSEGPQWFQRLYAHEPGLMKVILHP
ncbi:MAG: galactitol-1-phosphate 5-dehydrogenase [Candidatus Sumerlaeota bacterium]|nr:galactitol-1-phosphate 5-dehydrogenase [Candidatus Sumerlaeota bacterium]